jgi:hypothetical protein
MRHSSLRRGTHPPGLVRMATLVGLVSAIAFSSAGSATAYTTSSTGTPGTTRTHWWVQGANIPYGPSQIQIPERSVYRSSASRSTQKITVCYKIYQWTGSSWILYKNDCRYINVSQGRYARFPAKAFDVLTPHHYAALFKTYWQRLATGRTIGTRVHDYVEQSDNRCYPSAAGYCSIDYVGGQYTIFLDHGF